MRKLRQATARPANGRFDIYDGRDRLGAIEAVQGGFLARDDNDRKIGLHPTVVAAKTALMALRNAQAS